MPENYAVKQISPFSIHRLLQVENILFKCGKDMAEKDDLHHWDNVHIKNALIVCLCALKNKIYLVFNESTPVATYQTKVIGDKLRFQKLATAPDFSGCGIGSFCMHEIEHQAIKCECKSVFCEVYDKSTHAINFYKHKGYVVVGKEETLKYTELIMEKAL